MMRLSHTLEARQQQTQRIDPRQILASEILAWTTPELEAAVEREMAENPALETRDGDPLTSGQVGSQNARPETQAERGETLASYLGKDGGAAETRPLSPTLTMTMGGWEDELDPLDRVASSSSLRDHLRSQVGQAISLGVRADLLRYLIECVDERGYLIAECADAAEQFRASRREVDAAIAALQTFDPPGVGARDLHECLLRQAEYLDRDNECHPLALPILLNCWEALVARREDRIASRLRAPLSEVRAALAFLQNSLTPYPGSAFRPDWSGGGAGENGSGAAAVRPEIVFHRVEGGFLVEMPRDFESLLVVAPLWKRLADQPDNSEDESMRRYIREHVERAQGFLTGVARRGQTLRRIAALLIEHQQGFLETGNRAFLRPLTRQTLAEELGLDESVISRAVAEKWVQLPGGEVILLDSFFGNAHAVRDALATLIASENPSKPYADDEIADILSAQGFPLARRTVAKYRALEKILPARLRRRSEQAA